MGMGWWRFKVFVASATLCRHRLSNNSEHGCSSRGHTVVATTAAGIKFCTACHMDEEKDIAWVGSSYSDLLVFPDDARREAGFQLGRVQNGLDPEDWKPFDDVGAGTREIRIRDTSGIFRVMYVAKFEEAVYVLHCFQKKTEATSRQDKAIAEARYRAVAAARKTGR